MPAMVGLFPTCLGDAVHPQVVRDARAGAAGGGRRAGADPGRDVLRPAGLEQRLRRRRPPGRPARRSGRWPTWTRSWCRPGSCTAMMRLHWRAALPRRPRRGARRARRAAASFELSQYLVEELGAEGARDARCDRTVTYHDSCHMLRELRLARAAAAAPARRCRAARAAPRRPLLRIRRDVLGALPGRLHGDGRRQAGVGGGRRASRRS